MRNTKAALAPLATEPLPVVRRILYPTDLADGSSGALTLAIKLARQNHAELLLAHALPPPTPLYEIESAERPEAERKLELLVKKLLAQGIKAKRVLIKGSRPIARNIVECATFFGSDLIVMGSQSRRGVARFLRGSIAVRVIKDAPCPVLVVRNC